jgi:lysophospholipase L1-like esterase
MKRWFAIALAVLLGAGLFVWLRTPAYTNLPPSGGVAWVAFGDSLTAGYGANSGQDYPALLGRELGVPIVNAGVPGQTTRDGVERLPEILQMQPRVVLLCLGGNDGLRGHSPDEMVANLGRMIDEFHRAGAFVVLIGVRSASLLDKNARHFERLADEKKVLLVPDILRGVFGNGRLMSDTIHPNDEGYAVIAARLADALRPLLPQLTSTSR